jgi:hypothetical protein
MSIRRITISVPEETASRIKKAAGGVPVSAWVTELIEEHLDDSELERQWQELHRAVNPSAVDVRRAEALHERLTTTGARDRRKRIRRGKGAA